MWQNLAFFYFQVFLIDAIVYEVFVRLLFFVKYMLELYLVRNPPTSHELYATEITGICLDVSRWRCCQWPRKIDSDVNNCGENNCKMYTFR